MNYTHNMTAEQACHFASLKQGETMVLVVKMEQPPEGYKIFATGSEEIIFLKDEGKDCLQFRTKLPYPLNARVGMREAWRYHFEGVANGKYCVWMSRVSDLNIYTRHVGSGGEGFRLFKKLTRKCAEQSWIERLHPPQTMPKSLWKWATVVDVKVCLASQVSQEERKKMGFDTMQSLVDWLNCRYPGLWKRNEFIAVYEVRKD